MSGTADPFKVIRDGLNGVLTAAGAVPSEHIAWENSGYERTSGTPYLRPTLLPSERPEPGAVGNSAPTTYVGVYQVDVYAPGGKGAGTAGGIAAVIASAFKRGTTIEEGGEYIRISAAGIRGARSDEGWYVQPVVIAWWSEIVAA